PDHDPHSISFPNHEFVVRIMSQPDKVGAHLFGPTEQCHRILTTVSTPTAKRRLLVNANTAQEDWTSIQQDVSAARFNAAKPDLVANLVRLRFNRNVVELRILRRPQLQIRAEIDCR